MISPLYIELIADYDSVREKKVDNSVIKKRFILKKQKL